MNRRGFLKFAALAPIAAPTIAAGAAASATRRGATFGFVSGFDWPSLGSISFHDWPYREPTLAEQVNESFEQIAGAADSLGKVGAKAENSILKFFDLAKDAAGKIHELTAADPVVAQQMIEDDLFSDDVGSAA